jgi:xanthine dehydrogenase FAD-binding subunit
MYDFSRIILANSVGEAIQALAENPAALLICGGTDVLLEIREGKLAGSVLVSIHDIPDLKGITCGKDGTILIRPATSFTALAESAVIRSCMPMLGQAAEQIGGPQIRQMGTVGGNICNGATSADMAPPLLALNAVLELTGAAGTRQVPIGEFYTGPGQTVRRQDEVMTAIRVAGEDYEGYGGCYLKFGKRQAMEIATLGCAANVKLSPGGQMVEDLRLAYGVAAPTPIRCRRAESLARGQIVSPALLEAIAREALAEVQPRSSWRASREFRLQLVAEMGKRACQQAIVAAGGKVDA